MSAGLETPGVYYQCQRCGKCCRWPGFVKLSADGIGAIAAYVGVEEDDFIQRLTRLRPNRDGLALIDKPNGECHFLEDGGCAIQAVEAGAVPGISERVEFPRVAGSVRGGAGACGGETKEFFAFELRGCDWSVGVPPTVPQSAKFRNCRRDADTPPLFR